MDQGEPAKDIDKVSGKPAAEVSALARLGDEARGLLAEGMTSRQYLDRLIERQLHADALQFLAHALPKREAVWWAALCTGPALGPEPPAPAAAALEAAKAWVIDPKDEKRRAAFPAAEAADIGTPAGCTAIAAFFSGGSLAPANLAAVAPAEHLTGQMVGCALTLAAVIKEPEKAAEKHEEFLRTGLAVASGQHAWPEGPKEETIPKAEPTEKGRGAAYGYARRAPVTCTSARCSTARSRTSAGRSYPPAARPCSSAACRRRGRPTWPPASARRT
jgi:hypothetical protein